MDKAYLYFGISAIFNTVVSGGLGWFILRKNKNNIANITFALFCFAVSLWAGFYIIWPFTDSIEITLLSFQLLHIPACYVSIFYLHFTVHWLNVYQKKKKIIFLGYLFSFIFSLTTFTSYFISDIVPKFNMRYWAVPGPLYHFFLLLFFGLMIYASYLIIADLKNQTGVKKTQSKIILIGFPLAFLGGSTNYFLWYNINFPPYGNLLASSFVISTAYAIVSTRFMDVRMALRKSSVNILTFISLILGALGLEYIVDLIFPNSNDWLRLGTIMLVAPALPVLQKYYYRVANKYFFSSLYDPASVISNLIDRLGSVLDSHRIFDTTTESILSAMHPRGIAFFTLTPDHKQWILNYNHGLHPDLIRSFHLDPSLARLYLHNNLPIVAEELRSSMGDKYQIDLDLMSALNISVIVPLYTNHQLKGVIVIGPKETGEMYNSEDINTLEIIAYQTVVPLDSALLYEETKNYSARLKLQVDQATRDLELANAQLKRIEASKTDFISIASHQLRTPLTVIKGYISMMLEGNFGPLTSEEKSTLSKAYESNERLNRLVENLLYLSRLESDRLQFRLEERPIAEIIDRSVHEFFCFLDRPDIKYVYNKPIEELPLANFDAEKIRQVMLNLLDNALKYTREGTIAIDLKADKKNWQISIIDTGEGINKEELTTIFTRFSPNQPSALSQPEKVPLGLFVVKHIIDNHGGEIKAESKGKGKGTRINLKLPLRINNS